MDDGEAMTMANKVLVTVIVPVYNVADYLDRCVSSIVNQTYDNLEIILVDDGSPDSCPVKCDEWAKRDSRIRVIHQPNAGLSAARNAGLKCMSGDYVAFIDSDDYVTNDYIAVMLREALQTNADLVVCSFMQEDEEKGVKKVENHIIEQRSGTAKEMYELVASGFIMAWNKLYRSSLWNDMAFPVGKVHEDELVFHRIFFECGIVATVAKPLYHYGYNSQSIMHSKYSLGALAREEAIIDRIEYQLRYDCLESIPNKIGSIFADLDFAAVRLDLADPAVKREMRFLATQLKQTGILNVNGLLNSRQRLSMNVFTRVPLVYLRLKKVLNRLLKVQVRHV